MALNLLHCNGRWPIPALLWRRPSEAQRSILDKLRALVRACESRQEHFPLPPGRSGFEFMSRLMDLEAFASLHCDVGGYAKPEPPAYQPATGEADHEAEAPTATAPDPAGKVAVPSLDHKRAELHPYRSLDVDRLKLSGMAQWPTEQFLDGPFWLPYQEPRALLHEAPVDWSNTPSFTDSKAEMEKLVKMWDAQHLLAWHRAPLLDDHFCKIFNAYKSPLRDRQIGDRRIANQRELHLAGPSADLPQPYLLAYLVVPRGHVVRGYVSDRKDFYHQCQVTAERSASNLLPLRLS